MAWTHFLLYIDKDLLSKVNKHRSTTLKKIALSSDVFVHIALLLSFYLSQQQYLLVKGRWEQTRNKWIETPDVCPLPCAYCYRMNKKKKNLKWNFNRTFIHLKIKLYFFSHLFMLPLRNFNYFRPPFHMSLSSLFHLL